MLEEIKKGFKWIANHTGISWVLRKISSGWNTVKSWFSNDNGQSQSRNDHDELLKFESAYESAYNGQSQSRNDYDELLKSEFAYESAYESAYNGQSQNRNDHDELLKSESEYESAYESAYKATPSSSVNRTTEQQSASNSHSK